MLLVSTLSSASSISDAKRGDSTKMSGVKGLFVPHQHTYPQPQGSSPHFPPRTLSSANLSSDAMGSDPGDSTKMSGVKALESL